MNCGRTRLFEWRGRQYRTAFVKEPVGSAVMVRRLGLDGDEQADLTVHGGVDKAVYAYALAYYEFWKAELDRPLPPGSFGENLTIDGLDEDELEIGDELRVGSAILRVTQPRLPCVKMSVCFGRADMPKRFIAAGRPGTYFGVIREGTISADDAVAIHCRSASGWSVRSAFSILTAGPGSPDEARSLAGVTELGAGSRRDLEKRLRRRSSR